MKPSCVIVVPIYSQDLSHTERAALHACAARTKPYAIFFLHKQSIDINALLDCLGFTAAERQRIRNTAIDDAWLASVDSYNAMMLQSWFYRMFTAWTYLLVFQLDAWVLGDDLKNWLDKGYTYVGAPWTKHLGPDSFEKGVGNGGFSLRCVAHMIRIFESPRWRFMPVFRGRRLVSIMTLFRNYRDFPVTQRPFLFCKQLGLFAAMMLGWHNNLAYYAKTGIYEDYLVSIYAPLVFPWIRIPDMDEAAAFSIETNPRQTFAFYGVKRPFGCHAWERYDREFWLSTFPDEFRDLR